MDDIAIKVDKVAKDFLLLHDKARTIKSLFTSLSKRRRKNREVLHALKDVSLEVKKGEFFGIVGRNGSGKSTLLKMLAGIYQPTAGTIKVNGKLVPFIELGVGFNPELTGRENVYLNGAMMGFSTKETDAMYDEIVAFAELKEFMDQKLKNYSSGMQVRLAFSVAIKAQADILLVDEVLAVGDADFQRKCYDYFKSLKKNKKTVVFVSHDMEAVKEFCDRALLIDSNRVRTIGETTKVANEYLEIFLKETLHDHSNKSTGGRRSGSGSVVLREIELNKKVYTHRDETIELNYTIEKRGSTSQLMAGYAVRNAQGQYINSNHTWDVQENIDIEQGEKRKIKWKIPNIYEDGLYTINVYSWGRNHEVYDSIEDSVSFRVKRPHRSGSLVTIPVIVSIDGDKPQNIP